MRTSDPPEVTPEDAISDLYRANSLRLARAALLLVGDRATAEDVVQEAFYGLQRRWLRDGGPDDPAAYVRTAVMNGCRSVLRRRRAARRLSPPAGMAIGPALRPSGPPKFIVTAGDSIAHFARPTDKDASSYTPVRPVVQDAVTGKVLYTIPLPQGVWPSWGQVTAAPDNRTFVIAGLSRPAGAEFSYFRVHLSEDGRPDTPRLIPGLTVPESARSAPPTLSPDGRRIAYPMSTGVGVADITTGRRRTWTIENGKLGWNLAWAPDGRHLALVGPGLRTLDTGSPTAQPVDVALPGGIGRDGTMTNSVLGAAYEADGRALIAEVGAKIMRVPLGGNGRPVTLADGNDSEGIDVDGTGRFALYVGGHRIVRVDLRTGHRAAFPVPLPEDMGKGDTVDSAW